MKKNILVLMLIILFFCLKLSSETNEAYAWGPITHVYYTEKALQLAGSTTLTDIINNNKEWFYTGVMYPDVTVLYYYTEWRSYQATHAWTFQKALWNDAKSKNSQQALAFALGVGVHLLQDSVTHNNWIPEKIRATFVQNNIIHPLSEGLLEGKLATEDPIAEAIASTSFAKWSIPFTDSDAFYDPEKGRNLTPVEWADKILGNPGFIDEASTFNTILQGGNFYTKGFVIPEAGGWWSIYKFFGNVVKPFVSVEDANKYVNSTISVTVDWLKSGQGDNPMSFSGQTDPSGYDCLKSADSFVVQWTIVITITVVLIVLVYYKKRR